NHIGIFNIVDPGHMFIPDAFDAVRTKSILHQGWTLQCFAGNDLTGWEYLFQIIPAANCSSRSRGERNTPILTFFTQNSFEYIFHRMAGDIVMPEVIPEFLKLVED